MQPTWSGVYSAVTTPFRNGGAAVDYLSFPNHLRWQVGAGVVGIITAGSLGSGRLLSADEKVLLVAHAKQAFAGRTPAVPVIGTIYESSTAAALDVLHGYAREGADGVMLLPPRDAASCRWDAVQCYLDAVLGATDLEVMLYSNPAYREFTPEQIAALAMRHPNLKAVKDSSGRCWQITAIKLAAPQLHCFHGLDTMVCEPGADGWVSGMTNFAPGEATVLWSKCALGRGGSDFKRLYPLLALDTRPGPGFIEAITAAQGWAGFPTTLRPPYMVPDDEAEIRELCERIMRAAAS